MTKNKIYGSLTMTLLLFVGALFHQNTWGAPISKLPFRVNYIRPASEAVKVRDVNLSTNLEFKSGSSLLLPEYGANPKELGRIDSLMISILNDPTIILNKISIIGYSSPEGTVQDNDRLSQQRSASVRKYLAARYNSIPESKYSVRFGGENWEGLYEMVLNSETPDKMRVLKIIAEVDVMKGRESQLMALSGGTPYRYIFANFFPALRKVDLNFSYNIRNFNLSEASEIYKTNPKALSLEEIYNVASEYPKNSPEFRSMIITSAKLYPQNDVANINAATASILNGDNVSASYYLSNVKTASGDFYNVLGVNQALSDKRDDAITSLEKGVTEKSSDAEYNLLLLREPETISESIRDTVYIRDTIYQEVVREAPKQLIQKSSDSPQWALKTNLLYWLALQPNIEAEFYFANRWSLNIEYQVAWWSRPSKHQYYQYMHSSIEGRYWFKRDGRFSGHHLGLYAGGGYYDLSLGRQSNIHEGYQGEFAVAAGLSYGYTWNLNKSLWMEAGIGVGYVMTEYRRYNYQDTHYVYQSTERLQFFGPTKLRLTLIWRPQPKYKK